jgi:hypothetical protein
MISKELFCKCMKEIDQQHTYNDGATDSLKKIGFEMDFIVSPIEFMLIQVLQECFDDKENTWIEWFIYETDFGRKHQSCWDANKKEMSCCSPEELYQILIDDPVFV